jgi:hypothetical protein
LFELFSDSRLEYGYGADRVIDENDLIHVRMEGCQEKGSWACQDSLRVLRIGVKEAYLRPSLELPPASGTGTIPIQQQQQQQGPIDILTKLEYPACFGWFYDQIARLVNLRELCLVSVKGSSWGVDGATVQVRLTLEEGLDRWHGLKELEVLDVEYLDHQIGVEEVQWMVTHWPQLKVIRGLVFEEDGLEEDGLDKDLDVEVDVEEKDTKMWSEGVRWLKMMRPDIELLVLEKRWRGLTIPDYPDEDDDL